MDGGVILHLDLDAFYASVEQRDRPELRGKPVIVGGEPSRRGVVCAASYEARRYGVRSAMPSMTAARLCPRGVFLRPRMQDYKQESAAIMKIFREVSDQLEPMSIDEAYLDVSAVVAWDGRRWEEPVYEAVNLARQIKERVRAERQLTVSVGVASNKLLAKLASDWGKPDGLCVIPDRGRELFLAPLPVRTLHGVGKVAEQLLAHACIRTVGDLQGYRGDLRSLLGVFGERLRNYSLGLDDRPVEVCDERKSISSEETFERDTQDRSLLRRVLWEQAMEIERKLRQDGLVAQTVQVKIRYGDFSTLTRQMTFEDGVFEARQIYRTGCFLLGREQLVSRPLRLLGLGVANLAQPVYQQLDLWGATEGRRFAQVESQS